MSSERPSPRRFAAAMAERLDGVVPSGLTVHSQGPSIDIYARNTHRHASAAADIITEDGRSLAEQIDTAARSILGGAQDAVMEILMEQWPLGPSGRVVYPDARVEGGRLLMWFGDERAPVIVLPPLNVSDVIEGAA
jgi:hypothetical protein